MSNNPRSLILVIVAVLLGAGFASAVALIAVVPAMKNTCTLFHHGCRPIQYKKRPDGQLLIQDPLTGVSYWYDGSFIRSYGPRLPGKCPTTLQTSDAVYVPEGEARVMCEKFDPDGKCISKDASPTLPIHVHGTPQKSFGEMLEPTFAVNAFTRKVADGVVCSRARAYINADFEDTPLTQIKVRGPSSMTVYQILDVLHDRGVFIPPARDPQPHACLHGQQTSNGCVCAKGYTGPRCETKLCVADTDCVNGKCNAGLCECSQGWRGDACDKLKCDAPCVNGTCSPLGICMCDIGYEGDRCEKRICAQECVNGTCDPATGFCVCDQGWSGLACENRTCPLDCSGNGMCTAPDGVCVCDDGWKGDACDTPTCPDNCNRNGECDLETAVCKCDPEWEGEACDRYVCPKGCCTHGECDPSTRTCKCKPGWSGDDCSVPDDPMNTALRCPNIIN